MASVSPEETAGGSLGKSQEQPLHPCPKQTIRCAAPFGTSAPTIGLFWTNTARGLQGGSGRVSLAAGFGSQFGQISHLRRGLGVRQERKS